MKKTTFKQCAAGDVFEHQGQALIKTTKPNTAVNLNSGAFAHFHDGSLVDRSDLVLIHQADLPAETRDRIVQLAGGGSMIELFARKTAPGWDSWGDEVEGGENE
jgi:hypothetical protein